MKGINLIPAARMQAAARRSRIRRWSVALIAGAAVSGGGAVTFRAVWSFDDGSVLADIGAARDSTTAAEAELARVRADTLKARRADAVARLVEEHADWSLLLRAINHARSDGIALESFDLRTIPPPPPPAPTAGADAPPATPVRSVESYTLKLGGIASELPKVLAFIANLEGLGALERVAMKQSRTQTVRGVQVTGFDIECTLAERAMPTDPSTATAAAGEQSGESKP